MYLNELQVGMRISVGWNSAKWLGDTQISYHTELRVEAVGFDWLVLRCASTGLAYTAAFSNEQQAKEFMDEVTDITD